MRTLLGCLFLSAVAAGCGGKESKRSDLAVARDLSVPPDLAEPEDLAPPPDLVPPPPPCDAGVPLESPDGGPVSRYVINQLSLPQRSSDYAIDLNGDGKTDNQLGNIYSALIAQGLDPQTSLDDQVSAGSVVHLASVQSRDATLKNDAAARAFLYLGKPQMPPDFSGKGQFAIDPCFAGAAFAGPLVDGKFSSENPVTTKKPVRLVLRVPLFPGAKPVLLPLSGAHLEFTAGTDQGSGAPGLVAGRLHGSVRDTDVRDVLVPSAAEAFTEEVKSGSAAGQQIAQLFDTGGCTNPNGKAAKAGDGKIDPCEISENFVVKNLLAPDVQIWDANGKYAPSAANAKKDSISVGIAFTAVRAKF